MKEMDTVKNSPTWSPNSPQMVGALVRKCLQFLWNQLRKIMIFTRKKMKTERSKQIAVEVNRSVINPNNISYFRWYH